MGKSIMVSRIVFPGKFLVTMKYADGTAKTKAIKVAAPDVIKLSLMASKIPALRI